MARYRARARVHRLEDDARCYDSNQSFNHNNNDRTNSVHCDLVNVPTTQPNCNRYVKVTISDNNKTQNIVTYNLLQETMISGNNSMDVLCDENNQNHNNININTINSAKYFCIFCSQTFSDTESATRHYKCHINYYPIACLMCDKRHTDLESFVTHHSEAHTKELKGKFKKKDRPELDTWIEMFLLFQTTITGTAQPLQSSQSSHLSYASCVDCPVCVKMMEANNVDTNKLVLNPRYPNLLSLSVHLHQHLVYYRYECALCNDSGNCVRVTSRDSLEVYHLNEHQIDANSDINTAQLNEQLMKYFPQTLCNLLSRKFY